LPVCSRHAATAGTGAAGKLEPVRADQPAECPQIQLALEDYRRQLIHDAVLGLAILALGLVLLYSMTKRVLKPLNRLQRMLDAAGDAIMTINQHGTVLSANAGAQRLFDNGRDALEGRQINQLLLAAAGAGDTLHRVSELGSQTLQGEGIKLNHERSLPASRSACSAARIPTRNSC
jgi:HAMP domain-containing protein